ncbi:hypothetical protein HanIR_Chr17g0893141 [Helianthus annuus]|nr:hypothetical protein HanIR_Chr17g0893141 [Helianthus annuus]
MRQSQRLPSTIQKILYPIIQSLNFLFTLRPFNFHNLIKKLIISNFSHLRSFTIKIRQPQKLKHRVNAPNGVVFE